MPIKERRHAGHQTSCRHLGPARERVRGHGHEGGLSDWWTRDGVRGSRGGVQTRVLLRSAGAGRRHGGHSLDPEGQVEWNCVEGADEWVGTKLDFDLTHKDDETVVLFTHADWRDPSEFMAHCSARWAYFLLSLKSLVETGKGTPFPEDLKF